MSTSAAPASLSASASTSTKPLPSSSASSSNIQHARAASSTQILRPTPSPGLRVPSNRKTIYDRNLNRTRTAELSRASFAYLFAEMVTYAQRRVTGIQDLERRLNEQGYPLGLRLLSLLHYRPPQASTSRNTASSSASMTPNPIRPIRILSLLQFITTQLWRALFSRPADGLERSNTSHLEYHIIDNDPLVNAFVSVPKEMGQLNCGAYVAGIVEGCCDGAGLMARVSAHNGPTEMWPGRTVWLVRFEEGPVEREGLVERASKER